MASVNTILPLQYQNTRYAYMVGELEKAQKYRKKWRWTIPLYCWGPSKWRQTVKHEEGPRVAVTLDLLPQPNSGQTLAALGAGGQVFSGAFLAEFSSWKA